MRRRDFISLLGRPGAATWPLAARAQQSKLPTIGVLGASTPANSSPWTAALRQRLRELGWIEGRTVAVEYRWAEGRNERFAEIATEFVRLKVDVILTSGPLSLQQSRRLRPSRSYSRLRTTRSVRASSQAWRVQAATSPARRDNQSMLPANGSRLLHELLPDLRRMAIIGNVDFEDAVREIGEVQAAAAKLGLNADVLEIRHARDVVPAFETLKSGTQALYVCPDALVNANHARINTLALGSRLATMLPVRDYIGAGGLMSYGASHTDLFRRAGDLVSRILKGVRPADLPVVQASRLELVINATTARRSASPCRRRCSPAPTR